MQAPLTEIQPRPYLWEGMTVEGYPTPFTGQVNVAWFDSEGKPQRGTYHEDTLSKVEATYS